MNIGDWIVDRTCVLQSRVGHVVSSSRHYVTICWLSNPEHEWVTTMDAAIEDLQTGLWHRFPATQATRIFGCSL
tara:strand:+ start:569 stop:790 length:222 start_codon:yes stop_codon:yes gene_type:complete